MQRILVFLIKRKLFFLFLGLELIALSWISASRSFQRSAVLNSSSSFIGWTLDKTSALNNFIHLSFQNQVLAEENAYLRNLVYQLKSQQLSKINDSLGNQRFTLIEAKAISSSHLKTANFITINKGRVHGLSEDMGVIGPQGIVGKLSQVSDHFSTVIPIINPNGQFSAKLKETNHFGPLSWDAKDYRVAQVSDLARYVDIAIGDTVLTDNRSKLFPEGLFVGTVASVEIQGDQNFYEVQVNLGTDFAKISEVYVIKDLYKKELVELEESIEE